MRNFSRLALAAILLGTVALPAMAQNGTTGTTQPAGVTAPAKQADAMKADTTKATGTVAKTAETKAPVSKTPDAKVGDVKASDAKGKTPAPGKPSADMGSKTTAKHASVSLGNGSPVRTN